LIETDELKPRPRGALRDLVAAFDRWRAQKDVLPHTELTEIGARRVGLYRDVAEGPQRPMRPAGSKI